MSGLLYLQTCDFNIQDGSKGKIMCNKIRGISLVLFYSPRCQFCQSLIPIFKKLPGTISGCQFGLINVSLEKDIIVVSSRSVVPIEYVPLIILYVHGKPFLRYDGPQSESDIRNFVVSATRQLHANLKDRFSGDGDKSKREKEIPLYSVGVPLCGEDEMYLEFEKAYDDMCK